MTRLICIAALVAASLAVIALAGSWEHHLVHAQITSGVWEAETEDGRTFRLLATGDSVEVFDFSDPSADVCAAGHPDRFLRTTRADVADGHFEMNLLLSDFGRRSEPTPLATEVTIIGDFLSESAIEGTLRSIRTEDPECDSGAVAWSGEFLFSETSVPRATRNFSGRTEEGGSIELSLSSALDFVRELRIGISNYGAPNCTGFVSSVPLIPGTGVLSEALAEPVASGEFEFVRTVVVAETSPSNTVSVTGALLSDTEAAGTIRVWILEQPECDTGVLTWTATAPPPPPSPTPIDLMELPRGGTASPEGESSWPLWFAIGSGAFALGALVLARWLLRPR